MDGPCGDSDPPLDHGDGRALEYGGRSSSLFALLEDTMSTIRDSDRKLRVRSGPHARYLWTRIEKLPDHTKGQPTVCVWLWGGRRGVAVGRISESAEEISCGERLLSDGRPSGGICGPASATAARPITTFPRRPRYRQTLDGVTPTAAGTPTWLDLRRRTVARVPPAVGQRELTFLDVLHILGWHEAHHQGQAHATLNSYRAAKA